MSAIQPQFGLIQIKGHGKYKDRYKFHRLNAQVHWTLKGHYKSVTEEGRYHLFDPASLSHTDCYVAIRPIATIKILSKIPFGTFVKVILDDEKLESLKQGSSEVVLKQINELFEQVGLKPKQKTLKKKEIHKHLASQKNYEFR